jgi:mannose-6-phosphate isomerase-like protein (cupin superfamily)
VRSGRWRFFWGRWGKAGEVVLEEGDIINLPTGIFRAFENIGTDYGMIMAILGGDDAGGGVIWAPQVIEEAKKYGLILGKNGKLYDSKKGKQLPEGVPPMPLLNDEELKAFPELPVSAMVPDHVGRYWDMMALAGGAPCKVIGPDALLRDKPGFEIDLITRGSIPETAYATKRHEVLMVMRGYWKLQWANHEKVLAPGDTCAVPPDLAHAVFPSMTGEASIYRIRNTNDPAGPTWKPN